MPESEKILLKWKILTLIMFLFNVAAVVFFIWDAGHKKQSEILLRHSERPAISDRNGYLLVVNAAHPERQDVFYRYTFAAPQSAAALIGYISHVPGDDHGLSGIEKKIDELELGEKVRTTLDWEVQMGLEKIISNITEQTPDLKYIHAVIISGDGELIATAQRPVMEIEMKRKGSGESTVFMPSTYLVPISKDMMAMLGCPADAPLSAQEKLGFHIRQGFDGEAKGWVPGLKKGSKENTVTHAATSINYLLAYIAAREQKPLKTLKYLSLERLPSVKVTNGAIQWKSISRAENNAALNAIGEFRAHDGKNTTLYVFLRAACAEHDAELTGEDQRAFQAVCEKVQTALTGATIPQSAE